MGLPAVSVVLPVYNARDTLEACLDSIYAQTMNDYELLILDDGSADRSSEIARRRARSDSRIRLFSDHHRGLVAQLNAGLALARAPLIARMDADDLMYPHRLARQCAHLERHSELALVGCGVEVFPRQRVGAGMRTYVDWQNRCVEPDEIANAIYVESPIAHPTAMFRAASLRAMGGYRDGDFPEDYELWLRFHHSGLAMGKVREVLHRWRQRPDSLSRQDPRYVRAAFDRLRAHYLALDARIAGHRRLAFWGAGRRTRRRCSLLIERGFRPSVWVDVDPQKIGNRLAGVPVVGPEWLAAQACRPFVLGYVAAHGAREQMQAYLRNLDYRAGRDYLMVG
jgi:glycosyltransferase involved in cell wall biosynthesis